MKVKTSITLSPETLAELDRCTGKQERSIAIEQILLEHFRRARREERSRAEREALERCLNSPEFESDVLEYGIEPFELGDDASALVEERSSSPVRRQAS